MCADMCATVNLCVHMHVGQCAMGVYVCMCVHVHVCHSIHECACVHTCMCAIGCMLEVRKQFADFCSSLPPTLPPFFPLHRFWNLGGQSWQQVPFLPAEPSYWPPTFGFILVFFIWPGTRYVVHAALKFLCAQLWMLGWQMCATVFLNVMNSRTVCLQ